MGFLNKLLSSEGPRKPKVKFDLQKCKVLLKGGENRIRLQKSKLANSVKLQQREVAVLLEGGKDELARIRAEQMVRDELLIESYEIVEVLCETLLTRHNLLALNFHATKENPYPPLPPEIAEAVCSIAFASCRLDASELQTLTEMLASRFGPELIDSACAGQPSQRVWGVNSLVNPRLYSKLLYSVPDEWKAPAEFEELKDHSVLDSTASTPVFSGNAQRARYLPEASSFSDEKIGDDVFCTNESEQTEEGRDPSDDLSARLEALKRNR
ncbi:IST1-like protein [Galdieria sulphuraria]|nr:IST1-like protein [Galdieria sulphuraria]